MGIMGVGVGLVGGCGSYGWTVEIPRLRSE